MGIREQAANDTGNDTYSDAERVTRRSGARRADERTLGDCQEEAEREIQRVCKGVRSSLLCAPHLKLHTRRRKPRVDMRS